MQVHDLNIQVIESQSPKPGMQQIVLQAEIKSGVKGVDEPLYLLEGQLWAQQGDVWRMVVVKRGEPAKLQQPVNKRDIYPPGADAHAEIKQAVETAAREHKNILLIFGANWCYDCHVLDLALHRPDLQRLLLTNYRVVHVDVGEGNQNQDLMKTYNVPMSKGIPGIAVLDSTGNLLFSQKNGEFEHARALTPKQLAEFLEQWKPRER
jgi:hypothetical protein